MSNKWGAKDNRKLEARKDVLTYTSEPLAEEYEIIGYENADQEIFHDPKYKSAIILPAMK